MKFAACVFTWTFILIQQSLICVAAFREGGFQPFHHKFGHGASPKQWTEWSTQQRWGWVVAAPVGGMRRRHRPSPHSSRLSCTPVTPQVSAFQAHRQAICLNIVHFCRSDTRSHRIYNQVKQCHEVAGCAGKSIEMIISWRLGWFRLHLHYWACCGTALHPCSQSSMPANTGRCWGPLLGRWGWVTKPHLQIGQVIRQRMGPSLILVSYGIGIKPEDEVAS